MGPYGDLKNSLTGINFFLTAAVQRSDDMELTPDLVHLFILFRKHKCNIFSLRNIRVIECMMQPELLSGRRNVYLPVATCDNYRLTIKI